MTPIERDFYEERRRSWRRSAFWRGFLIASVIGIVVIVAMSLTGGGPSGAHIARVSLNGPIYGDRLREKMILDLAENDDVEAVIVRINSPGGTSAGSEEIYEALLQVASEKPVVAVMGEVAASGGYIAALAADHIIARGNTITGSIGVIMEYPDVTELLTRLGVNFETFRSSELKAEPSPYRKASPEARVRQQALIADSFAWFRDLVGTRRGLAGEDLDRVANGSVFTGRGALEVGLIDAIGGEPAARNYLTSLKASLKDLDVNDWRVEREDSGLAGILSSVFSPSPHLDRWLGGSSPRLLAVYK